MGCGTSRTSARRVHPSSVEGQAHEQRSTAPNPPNTTQVKHNDKEQVPPQSIPASLAGGQGEINLQQQNVILVQPLDSPPVVPASEKDDSCSRSVDKVCDEEPKEESKDSALTDLEGESVQPHPPSDNTEPTNERTPEAGGSDHGQGKTEDDLVAGASTRESADKKNCSKKAESREIDTEGSQQILDSKEAPYDVKVENEPSQIKPPHNTPIIPTEVTLLPDLESSLVVTRSEPRLPLLPTSVLAKRGLVVDSPLKSQSATFIGTKSSDLSKLASLKAGSVRAGTENKKRVGSSSRPSSARSSNGALKSSSKSSLKSRSKSRESVRSNKASTRSIPLSKLSVSKESLKAANQVYGSTTSLKKSSSKSSVKKDNSTQLSARSQEILKTNESEHTSDQSKVEESSTNANESSKASNTENENPSKITNTPVESQSPDGPLNKLNTEVTENVVNSNDSENVSAADQAVTPEEDKTVDSAPQENHIEDNVHTENVSSSEQTKLPADTTSTKSRESPTLSKKIGDSDSRKIEIDQQTGQSSAVDLVDNERTITPISNNKDGTIAQAAVVQDAPAVV